MLALSEPGHPRLHAVEHETFGEPLPLLSAPRLDGDQGRRPLAHLVGREELTRREDVGLGDVGGRPLVVDRELREAIHFVAPQVDAHRRVRRRREHVDDRPPEGDLPAVLDEVLASIARSHELGDELGRIHLLAGGDGDRLDILDMGTQPLRKGADAGDHDPRRPLGLAQAPHHPQATAHRLDPGAHPLERQGLPRREQLDLVRIEVGPQVSRELLGRRARGQDHEKGALLGDAGQPGDRDGPGRFGHGDGRGVPAEQVRDGALLAQQRGEVSQTHSCEGSDDKEG